MGKLNKMNDDFWFLWLTYLDLVLDFVRERLRLNE